MAKVQLHIDIGNAATVTEDGKPDPQAIGRMLRDVATMITEGSDRGKIRDANGNAVGVYEIIP